MNPILSLLMVTAGIAAALLLILLTGGRRALLPTFFGSAPKPEEFSRERISAGLLRAVLVAGGTPLEEAGSIIRERIGVDPKDASIDVGSWAERYAAGSTNAERSRLLELAVEVAMLQGGALPAAQYGALLDLAFGLGFQTDALARLRSRYGFEYVDHAKRGRPRSADRSGGRMTLYASAAEQSRCLSVLGLDEGATRQDVISAYRKLASQFHPDHLHEATDEEKLAAAEHFIDVTTAYQLLLRKFPGD